MVKQMKPEKFEALIDEYGTDSEAWPKSERAAALFAQSEAGQRYLAADQKLDEAFAAVRATGPDASSDHNAQAFTARLLDIPVNHAQVGTKENHRSAGFWAWLLPDITPGPAQQAGGGLNWLSAPALVSQAAIFVIVLGLGVLVGMNSGAANLGGQLDYAEIDLSDTLFVSAGSFELDEQ